MPTVSDLTNQTYQMLTWLIAGPAVVFGVVGALYYFSDIMSWFREQLGGLWDNSIGQWFE